MLYPSINEIRKKADSRYTLVILAAKERVTSSTANRS